MNTSLPMQFSLKDELDYMYMDPTMRRIREQQMGGQGQGTPMQSQQQQPGQVGTEAPDMSGALSGMIAARQQQIAQNQAAQDARSQQQGANIMGGIGAILAPLSGGAGKGAAAGPDAQPVALPLDQALPGGVPTAAGGSPLPGSSQTQAGVQLSQRTENPNDIVNTAPGLQGPSWWDKAQELPGQVWERMKAAPGQYMENMQAQQAGNPLYQAGQKIGQKAGEYIPEWMRPSPYGY